MAPETDASHTPKEPAESAPAPIPAATQDPAATGERASKTDSGRSGGIGSDRQKRGSARLKKARRAVAKASARLAVVAQEEAVREKDLQERVDHWLTEADTTQGRIFELLIGVLILTSCLCYTLEESLFVAEGVKLGLWYLEYGITVLFLIEYLVRWWAKKFSLRYLFSPLALIDLVAILPLLPVINHLGFVRVLRLFRILRLLRLLQSRKFFFGEITQEHLLVTRILFTIFALFFITGGLLYEVEHATNPAFESIFESLYFAVVTLTTVGFGDVTPVTKVGKGLTMVAVLAGITIIPWQLANLAKYMLTERDKTEVTCKHCGLTRHDLDASHCKACGNLIYQEYGGDADASI